MFSDPQVVIVHGETHETETDAEILANVTVADKLVLFSALFLSHNDIQYHSRDLFSLYIMASCTAV